MVVNTSKKPHGLTTPAATQSGASYNPRQLLRAYAPLSPHLGSDDMAVGLSCLTLSIVRFSRDHRESRFKNTMIPLP